MKIWASDFLTRSLVNWKVGIQLANDPTAAQGWVRSVETAAVGVVICYARFCMPTKVKSRTFASLNNRQLDIR